MFEVCVLLKSAVHEQCVVIQKCPTPKFMTWDFVRLLVAVLEGLILVELKVL